MLTVDSVAKNTPVSTAHASQTTTTTVETHSHPNTPRASDPYADEQAHAANGSSIQFDSTVGESWAAREGGNPPPQGQATAEDNANDSVSSTESAVAGESYTSVATPCLVAAVCKLLQNLTQLAPEEIITRLTQHGILKHLAR